MTENTIFIQIASYRDPELLSTLRDCIGKSKFPNNLRFSIAWQHSKDDVWDTLNEYINDKRFKIIDIDYHKSEGVCWARNLLQSNYNGEKYTLQLDSHHRFIQDWDTTLITMYDDLIKLGHPKPLITGYIPFYNPDTDPIGRGEHPWIMNFDRFSPDGVLHTIPSILTEKENFTSPIPARFYSAHFAFTTGDFVKEVPHDPNLYFHGEEHSISARAYTWGYDLFHPHIVIAWHEYTRKGKKKHWDDIPTWHIKNTQSSNRVKKLFGMDGEVNDIDFGVYGFGTYRTLSDYEKYAGISFQKRSVQQYTLDRKYPPNPVLSDREYDESFVRIFKHCIDIQYDKVPESDYDFWVVAYHHDGEGDTTMFRQDATETEIHGYFSDPDKYCKIWREFNTTRTPDYWVVWPHSKSKGWCERITGRL